MQKFALMALAILFIVPIWGQNQKETLNYPSWIRECQGSRVYINTEHLEIHEDCILVRDEKNVSRPIKEIFVDAHGVFTRVESLSDIELSTLWNIVWCDTCKAYRTTDIRGKCVVCGNQP